MQCLEPGKEMRGAGRRKSRRLATRSLGRASEADVGATTMDLTNLVVDSAFARAKDIDSVVRVSTVK